MKKVNKLYTFFVVLGLSTLAACNLVNVTDISPVNQLSEDEAITNIASAEKVLAGAYGQIRGGLELTAYSPGSAGQLGLTFGATGENVYVNNSVPSDDVYNSGIYTRWYKVINTTNHVIEKTVLLEVTTTRKDEIVAEARLLRALAHFYLLRFWGQFYKMDSPYGIVKRDRPVADANPLPRNTVKECYDLVMSDLDYAIEKATDFKQPVYGSKTLAKALKAKVLLYAGRYGEAAVLAQEVIVENKVRLEKTFGDVFKNKFNSVEALFATPFDDKSERNNKPSIFRVTYTLTPEYRSMMANDARKAVAITTVLGNGKFLGTTLNNLPLAADTEYFMRLAEVYLIRAEALVRSGGSFADARNAINAIRKRAVMPDIILDTKPGLLEAIRMEKIYELGGESGEEWFDMVRYAVEGDIIIGNIKPTVKSETQYILPIPLNTVQAGKGVVVQNPGY